MRIEIAGQNALIVYFADKTDPAVAAQIQAAVSSLSGMGDLIIDLVPSYASLLVLFDLERTDYFEMRQRLRAALDDLDTNDESGGNLVTLPVYYSEESGPDLELIA